MRNSLILLSATAMLLASCEARKADNASVQANTVSAADSAADETAIRGQVDQWLKLIKAKDAAAIAQLYAEDGAVMPPNAPIAKGKADVEKTWASLMNTPGFDLTFAPEVIVIASSGDFALDRGTYRLSVSPSGTPQMDTGKYVVVWRKVGGEWKAAADIFNSDLPAGGG
jgi:uncharacterized protein (TIGR02246 family)